MINKSEMLIKNQSDILKRKSILEAKKEKNQKVWLINFQIIHHNLISAY